MRRYRTHLPKSDQRKVNCRQLDPSQFLRRVSGKIQRLNPLNIGTDSQSITHLQNAAVHKVVEDSPPRAGSKKQKQSLTKLAVVTKIHCGQVLKQSSWLTGFIELALRNETTQIGGKTDYPLPLGDEQLFCKAALSEPLSPLRPLIAPRA